jgi:hypothetical protein
MLNFLSIGVCALPDLASSPVAAFSSSMLTISATVVYTHDGKGNPHNSMLLDVVRCGTEGGSERGVGEGEQWPARLSRGHFRTAGRTDGRWPRGHP